jgi:hypothetical protein
VLAAGSRTAKCSVPAHQDIGFAIPVPRTTDSSVSAVRRLLRRFTRPSDRDAGPRSVPSPGRLNQAGRSSPAAHHQYEAIRCPAVPERLSRTDESTRRRLSEAGWAGRSCSMGLRARVGTWPPPRPGGWSPRSLSGNLCGWRRDTVHALGPTTVRCLRSSVAPKRPKTNRAESSRYSRGIQRLDPSPARQTLTGICATAATRRGEARAVTAVRFPSRAGCPDRPAPSRS